VRASAAMSLVNSRWFVISRRSSGGSEFIVGDWIGLGWVGLWVLFRATVPSYVFESNR
jgi:hypothetical protein